MRLITSRLVPAMYVARSENRKPATTHAAVADVLAQVSADRLRDYVEMIEFPRHYVVNRQANTRARDLSLRLLRGFGYAPALQGAYDNIVVTSGGTGDGPALLLGAHYDSVPGSPGADDNG